MKNLKAYGIEVTFNDSSVKFWNFKKKKFVTEENFDTNCISTEKAAKWNKTYYSKIIKNHLSFKLMEFDLIRNNEK